MNFEELLKHVGHEIGYNVAYGYGSDPTAITVTCLTCKKALIGATEFDKALFDKLARHVDHKIVCVCYGIKGKPATNVAIECEKCRDPDGINEVLLDYNRPDADAGAEPEQLKAARLKKEAKA